MRSLSWAELENIEDIYKKSVRNNNNASMYLNLEDGLTAIVTEKMREENENCKLQQFFMHNDNIINVYVAVEK